ncbi:MAG: phosphatase PAP2 family protein [Pseudomonadota bacterium]
MSIIRPTRAIFRRQLKFLNGYADLREDRASEILAQLSPPLAFWSSVANLHPSRTRWTIELLGAALRLAMFVEMRFKHALACRRPLEYSPQVQPMILTPGHGTLPSGHATEAHIVAYVLWRLLRRAEPTKNRRWCDQLMRQAARIAINRTVAGVHFPVDSAAGQLLGLTLGDYFVRRCGNNGSPANYRAWRFDGPRFNGNLDFDWRLLYNTTTDLRLSAPFTDILPMQTAQVSALLTWLWRKAVAEWP